jgi:O-acetyl-ADP-ribose deacetylase (regulator of RNase III)
MFHAQAAQAMPLHDGQIVYAPANGKHHGHFKSVLFVIDELQQPLYDLVAEALEEAEKLALTSVSIPTIRTGVMSGVVETHAEALSALARSVSDFADLNTCVKTINIVVYHDKDDVTRLQSEL